MVTIQSVCPFSLLISFRTSVCLPVRACLGALLFPEWLKNGAGCHTVIKADSGVPEVSAMMASAGVVLRSIAPPGKQHLWTLLRRRCRATVTSGGGHSEHCYLTCPFLAFICHLGRTLLQQLQKLQALVMGKVSRSCKLAGTQTGTCLMVSFPNFQIPLP